MQIAHLSKRFAMKRFLGLSEEEIKENERLWREENGANLKSEPDAQSQLRSAGITPGGMSSDMAGQAAEAPPDMAAAAEAAPAAARTAAAAAAAAAATAAV